MVTLARRPFGPPPLARGRPAAGLRCGVLPSDCEQHPIMGNVFTVYRCKRCGDEEWL